MASDRQLSQKEKARDLSLQNGDGHGFGNDAKKPDGTFFDETYIRGMDRFHSNVAVRSELGRKY